MTLEKKVLTAIPVIGIVVNAWLQWSEINANEAIRRYQQGEFEKRVVALELIVAADSKASTQEAKDDAAWKARVEQQLVGLRELLDARLPRKR